jgi:hypothetical protein
VLPVARQHNRRVNARRSEGLVRLLAWLASFAVVAITYAAVVFALGSSSALREALLKGVIFSALVTPVQYWLARRRGDASSPFLHVLGLKRRDPEDRREQQ